MNSKMLFVYMFLLLENYCALLKLSVYLLHVRPTGVQYSLEQVITRAMAGAMSVTVGFAWLTSKYWIYHLKMSEIVERLLLHHLLLCTQTDGQTAVNSCIGKTNVFWHFSVRPTTAALKLVGRKSLIFNSIINIIIQHVNFGCSLFKLHYVYTCSPPK